MDGLHVSAYGTPQTRRQMLGRDGRAALGAAALPLLAGCGATPSAAKTPQAVTPAPTGFTAPGPTDTVSGANHSVPKTMYSFGKNGEIYLIAWGSNIFGTADQFSFLYAPAHGDGQWTVKVVQQQNTGSFAKAGLMVRATTDANAPFVDVLAVPGGDAILPEWRDSVGGSANRPPKGPGTPPVPCYLRLTKQGQTFILAASTDGSNWSYQFPHQSSAFGSQYLVGIVACSTTSGYGLDVFNDLRGFTPSQYTAVGV